MNSDVKNIPDVQKRREIAAEAMMSERQVFKVYRDPTRCRPSVVARVVRAAEMYDYPVPAA